MVKERLITFNAPADEFSSPTLNQAHFQNIPHTLPPRKLDKNKLSQRITSSEIFKKQIRNSIDMVLHRFQGYEHTTPSVHDQRLASQILSRGLADIDVWKSTRELLQAIAPFVERSLHHEEWIMQLHRGLRLCQEQNDTETGAHLNFYLGRVQQRLHADYQASTEYYVESEKLFAESGLALEQAEVIVNQAYVARLQEDQPLAFELIDKALQLLEDGSNSDIDCRARAYGHFVLGVLAYDQLEWANSESELRTALSLWRQLNDPYMVALSLSNLGLPLRRQKKHEEAIKCYQVAIEQLESLDDILNQGRLYMGLGNIYFDMNQPQQALEMYRKAEPIARRRNNPIGLAHCWSCIGSACRELEMWQEAEETIRKAITQYADLEHIEYVADTMIDLALVFYYQDLLQDAENIKKEAIFYLERIEEEKRREAIYRDLIEYFDDKTDEWEKNRIKND